MKRLLWLGTASLVLAGLGWLYANYSAPFFYYLDRRLYPVPNTPSPLAPALAQDLRLVRTKEFDASWRRTAALVDLSESQGLPIDGLRERLSRARSLADAGKFREAAMLVNVVELRLPRHRESLRPAADDEADPPEPEIRPKKISARKARRTR